MKIRVCPVCVHAHGIASSFNSNTCMQSKAWLKLHGMLCCLPKSASSASSDLQARNTSHPWHAVSLQMSCCHSICEMYISFISQKHRDCRVKSKMRQIWNKCLPWVDCYAGVDRTSPFSSLLSQRRGEGGELTFLNPRVGWRRINDVRKSTIHYDVYLVNQCSHILVIYLMVALIQMCLLHETLLGW